MIGDYKRRAAWLIGLGMVLTLSQFVLGDARDALVQALPAVGGVLLVWGCTYYAHAKDRHWAWGLLGSFFLVGLLVVFLLEDRAATSERSPSTEGLPAG